MIGAFASRPHYAAHLAPIVEACPPIAADVTLVASYLDLVKARRERRPNIVLAQHGAGQSYGGDRHLTKNPGYPGGNDNDGVALFLAPNQHAAGRWRQAYPSVPVAIVGSPRLDTLPARDGGGATVVAVSWHWDGTGAPELRSAATQYGSAVADLAKRYTVIGHGHPRWRGRERYWRERGIEFVEDFDDVCRRADVYVCDNSSTIFEFASTGRPVVVVNLPSYRRDVDHGLRFWEAATVGVNVDDPADLASGVKMALVDRADIRRAREAALDVVYAYRTGAGVRAASALVQWAATSRSAVAA